MAGDDISEAFVTDGVRKQSRSRAATGPRSWPLRAVCSGVVVGVEIGALVLAADGVRG
jgi:hypothetical protein